MTLGEGNHTLELNTSIKSETLFVDQVQYQLVSDEDIDSAWTEVGQLDGGFKYSDGWQEDAMRWQKWTYQSGAWVKFDFAGTVSDFMKAD